MGAAKKIHELTDLVFKIKEVDEMIKIHSSNPSNFMLEQYEAKKQKLLSYLIDELVSYKNISPYTFKIIHLAVARFYPDIIKPQDEKQSENEELKDLEKALT